MDRNVILAFALSFLVLTMWMMWQGGTQPPQGTPVADAPAQGNDAPTQGAAPPGPTPVQDDQVRAAAPAAAPRAEEKRIVVSTPLYEAELTSRGGGIRSWRLKQYVDAEVSGRPWVELATFDPEQAAGLVTPSRELGIGDLRYADFAVSQPSETKVVFEHSSAGITIRKIFDFAGDSYLFRLRMEVENRSGATISPSFEVVWPVWAQTGSDHLDQAVVALHDGDIEKTPLAALGTPGFFGGAFGGKSGETLRFAGEVDWAGAQTRYFLTAVLPELPKDASAQFVPVELGRRAEAIVAFPATPLPPQQSLAREYRAYFGPKEPERLDAVGSELARSIDLGFSWVAPLTRGFLWLLHACHAVIPNYGIAIILLTVMVRVVTAPLTTRQMRSMKRMGELQPKIRALQEKFKDDRQRQSQEMMKLYRESGVNPLGGCLPILLQFPVFIGLYYALQSSIDLRQAPFVGWIRDLSAPETLLTIPGLEIPLRLLPIVMGGSMVLQQRLTPTTMDPAQARMMMTVMPVMFTFLFYQFPSGLVLYWLVSNLLAVGHQMWINRSLAS